MVSYACGLYPHHVRPGHQYGEYYLKPISNVWYLPWLVVHEQNKLSGGLYCHYVRPFYRLLG